MIKISKFAVGNINEAYISESFSNSLNIVHSDDNNKGKTIVTQGIMFTLGNVPLFPEGFENFNDYYFVVVLEKDEKTISICRKKDSFVVKVDDVLSVFDSLGEFKHFFDKQICPLPNIMKDGSPHVIDPSLFFEMTFLPQDNRRTSNIINSGRYNKDDLMNAVFSIADCGGTSLSNDEIIKIKGEIKELTKERKKTEKMVNVTAEVISDADYALYTTNKKSLDKKFENIERIKGEIIGLSSELNRLTNRKIKNQVLLGEINSLNRELAVGKLVCGQCGSDQISYQSQGDGVKFDISDSDTRSQILSIIKTKINVLGESIEECERKLEEKRSELINLLNDKDINIGNYLCYKNEIADSSILDQQIKELDKQIAEKKSALNSNAVLEENIKKRQSEVYRSLIGHMNDFYSSVDEDDPLTIEEIFTKSSVNYSGSQGAVFLLSRLYAFSKTLKIDFPIFVDHFRGAELSSMKEDKTIELFKSLGKQVVLSCTLKREENNKYDNLEGVNSISFDVIPAYHLMNENNVEAFRDMLSIFMLNI